MKAPPIIRTTLIKLTVLIMAAALLALGWSGVWWIQNHTDGQRHEYDYLELSCHCTAGQYETYREIFESVESSIRLLK